MNFKLVNFIGYLSFRILSVQNGMSMYCIHLLQYNVIINNTNSDYYYVNPKQDFENTCMDNIVEDIDFNHDYTNNMVLFT